MISIVVPTVSSAFRSDPVSTVARTALLSNPLSAFSGFGFTIYFVEFLLGVRFNVDVERLENADEPTLNRTLCPAPYADLADTILPTCCTSAAL